MGQYYIIANVDKKEMLKPHSFDCGAKLTEWCYARNDMVLAMLNLMNGDWKGDRVFVVGDYAEDDDKNEAWYETLRDLIDELGFRGKQEDGYDVTLYGYASENFKNISNVSNANDYGYRYIYNHELKEVIDLKKCKPDRWGYTIAPLPMLLTMGNDRGGGDFHKGNSGYEYVGTWCSTSQHIEVTKEPIEGLEYEKFVPGFEEY